MKVYMSLAAALSVAVASVSYGAATYVNTVGVYAASPTPTGTPGTLTGDATSNSSVGGVTIAQFTTDVANAYAANKGGIFNAETTSAAALPGIPLLGAVAYVANGSTYGDGAANAIVANYGIGASKQISFYESNGAAGQGFSPNGGGGSTASGAAYIGFSGNITPIITFSSGLSEVGITMTARGANRTAVLQANLSNGAFITSTPQSTGTAAPNDTVIDQYFFGFAAPAGTTITSLQVVSAFDPAAPATPAFTRFDDLGFVVAAVPEPTTLAAVAGGALALLRRRRSI